MSLAAVGTGVGLARLAARRLRADLPFMLAAWLVLSAATTLMAAAFQYSDAVAIGGLRRAVLDAVPGDRGVAVQTSAGPSQVTPFDVAVSGVLTKAFGPVAPIVLAARSTSLAPLGLASDQAARHLTLLGGYADLEAHARLTAGSWPVAGRNPVQATLSTGAAQALALAIGDQLTLVDASTPAAGSTPLLTVVVTGIWSADPGDSYWLGDPLDLNGILDQGSLAYRGPFMVAPADLLQRGLVHTFSLTWRAGLATDQLFPGVLPALERAVPALPASIAAALPPRQAVNVSTGLTGVLSGVGQSLALAHGGVTLLTLQFVVLAVYAVFLVAALLAERRRRENRILQARGATWLQVVVLATGEAILIAVPAVLVAPLAAALALHLLATGGPLAGASVDLPLTLSATGIAAANGAGLVAVVALVAPSLPTGSRVASIRVALGREGTRFPVQRFGIDIALLTVAGIALWQLRLYGSPVIQGSTGELGVDPLLVAGPAVGLAACSLLATRALPRLARLGERLLVKRPNLVPQLGAHDLARRPLRSIRPTLLVMLAAGLTTFAVVYDATWFRSQADQAAYQAAADIRVVTPSYSKVPGSFVGPSYRAMPGVTAASPAIRTTVEIGGTVRSAELMGVDAVRMPTQVDLPEGPDGPLGSALGGLAGGRPAVPAIALPGQALRLAVTVDANLQAVTIAGFGLPEGEVVPAPHGIDVTAVILDGDGGVWRFTSTNQVAFSGKAEELDIPLRADAATGATPGIVDQLTPPLRLEALEVLLTPPNAVTNTTGTVDIRGVQASDVAAGTNWSALAFDPGQPGWSWARIDAQKGQLVYDPPAGLPNRISLDSTNPIGSFFQESATTFRVSAAPATVLTVNAIASSGYLAASGQHVGDTIVGSVLGNPVHFQIVGEAVGVPPLDPSQPFLVVDGPTLALADYFGSSATLPVTEWWLSVEPGQAADVARKLGAPPFSAATIISREALQLALQGDPVALGVVGALLLGAISAVLFAALGFLVSASASIGSRADEFGLLRALGLTDGQLIRWLAAEQALLLAVGVAVGMALGVAFGWVVLPAANFTPTGAAPVPEATLIVPLQVLAAMAVGSLGLLVATLLVARRIIGRISVAATLRAVVE
jgi:hypothetical protein